MSAKDTLLKPEECAMLLVDFQAGLGFRRRVAASPGRAQQCSCIGAHRRRFQDSGDRIDFCVACVQRAFSSRPAGSASFRKAARKKKYECLGR